MWIPSTCVKSWAWQNALTQALDGGRGEGTEMGGSKGLFSLSREDDSLQVQRDSHRSYTQYTLTLFPTHDI